jgi:hypothetical protein
MVTVVANYRHNHPKSETSDSEAVFKLCVDTNQNTGHSSRSSIFFWMIFLSADVLAIVSAC